MEKQKLVGISALMTREQREALRNHVRMVSRNTGTAMSVSSLLVGYLMRDPLYVAELRRVRARARAKDGEK